MRKTIGLFLLILAITGCTKDRYQARGTLKGFDPAQCGCCEGIILIIDNDPTAYRVDSLRFMEYSEMAAIEFPKRIEFNFDIEKTCSNIKHLIPGDFYIHN